MLYSWGMSHKQHRDLVVVFLLTSVIGFTVCRSVVSLAGSVCKKFGDEIFTGNWKHNYRHTGTDNQPHKEKQKARLSWRRRTRATLCVTPICTQRWTLSVINWRRLSVELSWQHLRRSTRCVDIFKSRVRKFKNFPKEITLSLWIYSNFFQYNVNYAPWWIRSVCSF